MSITNLILQKKVQLGAGVKSFETIIGDGDTAAWYQHDSPVGLAKHGDANVVSGWIDKQNYSEGANLITNGGFDADTGWTKQTGWTISNGVAVSNGGVDQWIYQTKLTVGKVYKITFTITEYTSGIVKIGAGNDRGLSRSSVGTFTEYVLCTSAGFVGLYSVGFVGKADNISALEVISKNIVQTTLNYRPLSSASGVLFDGVNDFLKSTTLSLNQPAYIYLLARQKTWVDNARILSGTSGAELYQSGSSPANKLTAGTPSTGGNVVLNSFQTIRVFLNGANSHLKIGTSDISGNFGSNNVGELAIGAYFDGSKQFSSVEVKEIIIRKSDVGESQIFKYLENKRLSDFSTINNVLIIGNSITTHPVVSYWWGSWGMAASTAANDFVHKLQTRIRAINPSTTIDGKYCIAWEQAHTTFDKTAFDSYFSTVPQLVIIRLGENVTDTTNYQTSLQSLVDYIKTKAPLARIVITGNFWASTAKDTIHAAVCTANKLTYIPLSDLNIEANRSYIGAQVFGDDGQLHTIENAGVASHPGDAGMSAIADRIFNYL